MPRKKTQKVVWGGLKKGTPEFNVIRESILASEDDVREIENRKEALTDNFNDVHAKTGIPRRIWNALVKFYFFGNAYEKFEKDKELKEVWDEFNR